MTTIQQKTKSQEIAEYAQQMAGNWQKFESFAWFDAPEDGENWAIFYTHHRDSTLISESNAAIIEQIMQPFTESEDDDPDVIAEDHNHWAVGWIAGYAIRCLRDGEPTAAIAKWHEIQCQLDGYPILNEEHYSELECQATFKNVYDQTHYRLRRGERTDKPDPEGEDPVMSIADEVHCWLSENEPGELESTDGQGGYPDDDAVDRALIALGYLVAEDENEEEEGGFSQTEIFEAFEE